MGDHVNEIDRVAGRERIEAAERLFLAKLGRLGDHHPARRHSAVTPSVKQHRARDYPKHLVTRQERIVTLDLHLAGVGVISDELEAGDRKSVVEGKSVSVRVDLGGRRIMKNKNIIKSAVTE